MDLGRRGIRSLAVARTNDEGKWTMMGILTFLDPPRPDTKDTIERAMEYGVDVKMITGEHSCCCMGCQGWVQTMQAH
jgi:H+-transporting ATPase